MHVGWSVAGFTVDVCMRLVGPSNETWLDFDGVAAMHIVIT